MTSGIYELKFGPDNYIGQSIDIENRWKQHSDKLTKGTAAKAMQEAYNRYGEFSPRILYKCHYNHLDLIENFFITRLNPTLNTSRPPDPFENMSEDELNEIVTWLGNSTIDLIKLLNTTSSELNRYITSEDNKDTLIRALKIIRSDQELDRELGRELKLTKIKLKETENTLGQVAKALKAEQSRTWWNRLFN